MSGYSTRKSKLWIILTRGPHRDVADVNMGRLGDHEVDRLGQVTPCQERTELILEKMNSDNQNIKVQKCQILEEISNVIRSLSLWQRLWGTESHNHSCFSPWEWALEQPVLLIFTFPSLTLSDSG